MVYFFEMASKANVRSIDESGEELISTNATIGVVGLGYVGLQLAHVFDDEGYTVHGFDVDEVKIQQFQNGIDPTNEVGSQQLQASTISFTTNPSQLRACDFILLAVPTPIDDAKKPDLSLIEAAGETVGAHLTKGTTVVLESTVYPGATQEVLRPTLESESGLTAGKEFFIGYSPERVVPGQKSRDFRDIVKIVSAEDETTAHRLKQLYERPLNVDVHIAPTIETAEAAKCLENVQRDLNIGLINEFALACNNVDLDIDPYAVLTAAGTKWNFHQYSPGLVGGHCLPVDPYFLMEQFERKGHPLELPKLARQSNEQLPKYVVARLLQALEQRRKRTTTESTTERVLLAGLSYKPGSADLRSTPIKQVISELQEQNVDLIGYEPHVDNDTLRAEFAIPFQNTFSASDVDALVILTPHQELQQLNLDELSMVMNDEPVIVDLTRTIDEDTSLANNITYISL